MAELKPCPFCGRKPSKIRHYSFGTHNTYFTVKCKGKMSRCFVKPETAFCNTEAEAIEAWNRRAGDE